MDSPCAEGEGEDYCKFDAETHLEWRDEDEGKNDDDEFEETVKSGDYAPSQDLQWVNTVLLVREYAGCTDLTTTSVS